MKVSMDMHTDEDETRPSHPNLPMLSESTGDELSKIKMEDLMQVSEINDQQGTAAFDVRGYGSCSPSEFVAGIPSTVSPQMLHPAAAMTMPGLAASNSIPEFLYQLTKMLTDSNHDIIEWTNGMIEVHNPHKLEKQVLHKYFRHSKFASFQRQLNYFGFRKLAGKGKMAPCSYVNDFAKGDITSLLLIKRKTSTSTPSSPKKSQSASKKDDSSNNLDVRAEKIVNSVLEGIRQNAPKDSVSTQTSSLRTTRPRPRVNSVPAEPGSPQALAQTAVGRGIRHGFTVRDKGASEGRGLRPRFSNQIVTRLSYDTTSNLESESFAFPERSNTEQSLSQVTSNYRNSLNEMISHYANQTETELTSCFRRNSQATDRENEGYIPGQLSRNSSLVDLAMIPLTGDGEPLGSEMESSGFCFIDFPHEELRPTSNDEKQLEGRKRSDTT